jgi:hypothetical protein
MVSDLIFEDSCANEDIGVEYIVNRAVKAIIDCLIV